MDRRLTVLITFLLLSQSAHGCVSFVAQYTYAGDPTNPSVNLTGYLSDNGLNACSTDEPVRVDGTYQFSCQAGFAATFYPTSNPAVVQYSTPDGNYLFDTVPKNGGWEACEYDCSPSSCSIA